MIITMNPILAVLAAPILGQRITRKMIYGLFLSFIGVVVVTGWSPNTDIPLDERLRGDLMIMLALCVGLLRLTSLGLCLSPRGNMAPPRLRSWYGTPRWHYLVDPWWLLDVYHVGFQVPNNEDLLAILYSAFFNSPSIHLVRSGCREDRCDIRILLRLPRSAIRSSGWLATIG